MKKKIFSVIIILFILFAPVRLNAAKTKKLEICNSTTPAGIMYTYIDESKHPSYVSNPFEIEVYNFVAEGGKTVYCIHGGKLGPASGNCKTTQLVTDFLSEGCDSGGNLYECGLVRIISHALKNGYGYVETMTALRLWTAAESGEPGAGIATNSELGQRVTIKQKVYTNTAELINTGYDPRNPEKLEYVLFQPTGNEIAKSFELYNVATTALIYTATFKVVDKEYKFDKDKRVTIEINTTLKDVNNIIGINPLKNAKFISKTCSGNICSVVLEATVDLSRSGNLEIPIEITYKDSEDVMSKIKEYKIPIDEYQTFLVLEDSEEIKKKVTVNIGPGECNSDTTCCPGDSYPGNDNCKCDDINVKYDIPNNCSQKTEGTIEDPKLCAIAIKNSGRYKLDDISYDGKNLCSVYCREKYEFKFMPGLEAIAGRTYKYNVQGWSLTTSDKYLTAVKATRECISSQINYKQWKEDYIKINTDILNAWNNWKEWEAKWKNQSEPIPESKSCPTCSGGCCGGSPAVKDPLTGAIITPAVPCEWESSVPGESDSWTWYKWTNAKYNITLPNGNLEERNGSGNSGSSGIKCNCSTCSASSSAKGDQGISASIEAGKAETAYRGLLTRRNAMINAIEDCNYQLDSGVISKIKGYEYKSTVDFDYDDKYGEGTSKMTEFDSDRVNKDPSMSFCTGSSDDGIECKLDNLCPECNTDISEKINEGLDSEDLIKWECSGTETSAKCTNTKYAAPKSKAAYVTVTSEEATYQKNNFYTQLGTGVISTSQGNNYIQLEDSVGQTNWLYPLELNKKDGSYETILRYEGINEDFRKQLNLTKIEDIEYKCNINVKNEMPLCEGECPVSCDGGICPPNKPSLGFFFRPIKDKVFPNENREKGKNWTTDNANNIIKEIEEREKDFWLKTKPKYTVTLLPENLKKIKKYNDDQNSKGGYQDYSIECETNPIKSDFGYCGSTFLKDILKNEYASKFEKASFEAGLYYWKKAK